MINSPRQKRETIAVLGVGHIGLPTALAFAQLGWRVIAADSNQGKITQMKSGECPFFEPGMQELLVRQNANPRFTLTTDIEGAIRSSTILFICVGTPQTNDGAADLSQVESLARLIARNLNGYKLVVEKSTVPAITGQWMKRTIARYRHAINGHNPQSKRNGDTNGSASNGNGPPMLHRAKTEFEVASNPEFLQEGQALRDFFHPDRIVCGVESERAREILARLYRPFDCPVVFTDLTTAELIKHAANAFLAMKISFINMVADVCDAVGGDVRQVASGIGLDTRIGKRFLDAGIGFGGYCLPKDLAAFTRLAQDHLVDVGLLREVKAINENRIPRLIAKLRRALWVLRGKKIGVLGLAFKAGTDDVRETPALKAISALLEEGAIVHAYDPKAIENTRAEMPEIPGRFAYCDSVSEAARGAHALLLLTEWPEFKVLEWNEIREHMELPVIVDGRNMLEPAAVRALGFEYYGMGCDSVPSSTRQRRTRSLRALRAARISDSPTVIGTDTAKAS
jgi:UDPglucose 6-dehydrogenase